MNDIVDIVAIALTSATAVNAILLKIYSGYFNIYRSKVEELCKRIESMDRKIDKMLNEYQMRISKLEENVDWLIKSCG